MLRLQESSMHKKEKAVIIGATKSVFITREAVVNMAMNVLLCTLTRLAATTSSAMLERSWKDRISPGELWWPRRMLTKRRETSCQVQVVRSNLFCVVWIFFLRSSTSVALQSVKLADAMKILHWESSEVARRTEIRTYRRSQTCQQVQTGLKRFLDSCEWERGFWTEFNRCEGTCSQTCENFFRAANRKRHRDSDQEVPISIWNWFNVSELWRRRVHHRQWASVHFTS